jgi:pantetheine-phosphate adenylyltransferase
MKNKWIFPGSFDPFTVGHKDIVDRGLALADEVVVAIGIHPEKHGMFSVEERMEQIRHIYADEPRVTVTSYEGLTTDLAQSIGATALLRSVRSVKDFEYERDLADINRQLTGIETVILLARPEYAAISSSVVRELLHHKQDVSQFLP